MWWAGKFSNTALDSVKMTEGGFALMTYQLQAIWFTVSNLFVWVWVRDKETEAEQGVKRWAPLHVKIFDHMWSVWVRLGATMNYVFRMSISVVRSDKVHLCCTWLQERLPRLDFRGKDVTYTGGTSVWFNENYKCFINSKNFNTFIVYTAFWAPTTDMKLNYFAPVHSNFINLTLTLI